MKKHRLICFLMISVLLFSGLQPTVYAESHIKWIDFTPTCAALKQALDYDVKTKDSSFHMDWITLLALVATANGGNFSGYQKKQMDIMAEKLSAEQDPFRIVKNQKLLQYYIEAYKAILGGMVGEYTAVTKNSDGIEMRENHYGLRVFSPIASGFSYSHYDDFGVSRSYGYKRRHLGHDIMGSIGTPIVAVESGYVEACGWNQYGGWRIGIRSFDGKRYYYYAHLRKDHPYADLYEGKIVNAGEVIGYLGMTGYSAKKNVNNINVPHLHFGLEIIFDQSQKDGWNQIWLNLYPLTDFLSSNRSKTYRNTESGDSESYVYYEYPETPD